MEAQEVFLYTLGVGALATSLYIAVDSNLRLKMIPKVDNIKSRYIAPSRLSVEIRDFDGDGELEAIIRIDGKPYSLRDNSKDGPKLLPYEIKKGTTK